MSDGEFGFAFEGPVVEWRGPAPFYFVRIPEEVSVELKIASAGLEYWGQVPVVADIRGVTFATALFPKDGVYLLPLKNAVRARIDAPRDATIPVRLNVGRGSAEY